MSLKISQLPQVVGSLLGDEIIPIVQGETTKSTTVSDIIDLANSTTFIEKTYSEMSLLIDNEELVPGSYYKITDYMTCYDQPDYDQNRNPITVDNYRTTGISPIIVLAISANKLALDGYQPEYPKDKIKYDISFNQTEITGGTAYGRITERIDEFNNRTDYDHRVIEFKRYRFYYYSKENNQPGTIEILNDGTVNGTDTLFTNFSNGDVIAYPNSSEKFFKIASIDSDVLMTVTGSSISPYGGSNPFYLAQDGNYDSYYQSNVDEVTDFQLYLTFADDVKLNNYIGDYSDYFLEGVTGDFLLANNVFKDGPYRSNTIGNVSYNNTMNDDCTNNTIGNRFYNNITDDDFDGNIIENYFNNNLITANFQYNQIGENFEDNIILNDSFYRNRIGNDFRYNWLDGDWGFDFQNNQIGNQFNNNEIFRPFYKNRILNGYNQNIIKREFQGNDIGNAFNENNIYDDFYDNRIKDYFENNNIGDENDPGNGQFGDNTIGNNFKGNSTLGEFSDNQIGNDFVANQTDYYFHSNVIGNNFFINNISYNFAYNKIGNLFISNDIENDFGFGGGQTRGNVIGNNFNDNTIGEYFYDNTIGDNFASNTVGDDFYNNEVSYSFTNNTIGTNFRNNEIKASNVNSTDFTQYLGNITSVTFSSIAGADNTYSNVGGSSTSGIGINATFTITVTGGFVSDVVIGDNSGKFYENGDTVTIPQAAFGGSEDLVLTVNGISDLPMVYGNYNKTIQRDTTGTTILTAIQGGMLYVTPNITEAEVTP